MTSGGLPGSRERRRLPPNLLPRADEERGQGSPTSGPAPIHPTSWFLRDTLLPESSPLIVGTQERRADLYRTTATRWQMQGSQPSAWRTRPRVLCLQDVKSKQDGGQACGEQEEGHRWGAGAPRPAGRCEMRLAGRTVAQQEVLMRKVGKKLPTAMETSRKTRVPAGRQSGPVTMPSSLVSGWTSRTGPKGPASTPRGAPASTTLTRTGAAPGSLLRSPALCPASPRGQRKGTQSPHWLRAGLLSIPAHQSDLLRDMVSPRGPTDRVGA